MTRLGQDLASQSVLTGRIGCVLLLMKSNVKSILTALTESSGEVSGRGVIVTDDRGYGKPSFICAVSDKGFSSVFVVPNYPLDTHPFIKSSSVSPGTECYYSDDDSTEHLNKEGVIGSVSDTPIFVPGDVEGVGSDDVFLVEYRRGHGYVAFNAAPRG